MIQELLPFGDLPKYKPRQFVPEDLNFEDWDAIRALFDAVETKAKAATTVEAFEEWLVNCGELNAALSEERSKRHIAMTCHTDDPEAEAAYLRYVENIQPKLKPRQFEVSKIYLAHPMRLHLPMDRYMVMDRDYELHVEMFREENIPLETELTKLGQQYQKLSGSLTVEFDREERTLVQMGKYQEETDRGLRERAWKASVERRMREVEQFESLFDQMLELRQKIAENAGYRSFLDYWFRALGRFDYTPEDCRQFHDAIEQEIVPAVKALQEERRVQLGLDQLKPWDLSVDPTNLPPLRPFEQVDGLIDGAQQIFDKLDEDLSSGFQMMQDLKLLDLDNRKGKAPGGYQSTLGESRLPFIFMNAVGVQRDVETMLHEAGHAFHAIATRPEDLFAYRSSPIEFAEVASMSMELLGSEFLNVYYDEDETRRARKAHLEGIIGFFPWMAVVDAFQHWLYSNPGHTHQQRADAFLDLMDRFGGIVDWSGFEEERKYVWHRQLHIFLYPLYYVEYGIAQLGALQIWKNSKSDSQGALKAYQHALALGGSRPLPELFEAAGAQFSFSRETIAPLVNLVQVELKKLN